MNGYILSFLYLKRFKKGSTWNMNFDGKNVNPIMKIEKLLHAYINLIFAQHEEQQKRQHNIQRRREKRCKTCSRIEKLAK